MASEFVSRWVNSFNSPPFASEDIYTPDCTLTTPGHTYSGLEEIRAHWESTPPALPDARLELVDALESPNRIAIEVRWVGTHTGPWLRDHGKVLPATGRKVDLPICFVLEMELGKVRNVREYYDRITLMTQLGLMPAPASA